jgi:peptidoglycan/LPS O-acetylase OafA/YrhL
MAVLLLVVHRWGAVLMVASVTMFVAVIGIVGSACLAPGHARDSVSARPRRAVRARHPDCRHRRRHPRPHVVAVAVLGGAALVVAVICRQGAVWTRDHLLSVDLALGPAIACLLAGLATVHAAPLLRQLDTRPIRPLGLSSYGLYLTQSPIVAIVYEVIVAGRVAQGVWAFTVTLAIALPLTVLFARIFASVFEIRFLQHRRSSGAARRQRLRAEVAPG